MDDWQLVLDLVGLAVRRADDEAQLDAVEERRGLESFFTKLVEKSF